MNELARRAEGDQEGLGVVATLRGIWKLLSSRSHPSPAWQRLKIEEATDGTLRFPSTSTGGDRSSERVADNAADMLEMCRGLIALYREMDEPDEE